MNKKYPALPSIVGLAFFAILFFTSEPAPCQTIRYLYGIDGVLSGIAFSGITNLYVDNKNNELYVMDNDNKRVVITDLEGLYIHQFKFMEAGINDLPLDIAVADEGMIYIAETNRILVADYRGMYKYDLNLTNIPYADAISIQSIKIDGDKIYIGDSGKKRVVVLDRHSGNFITEFTEGLNINFHLALDDNGFYVLDASIFSVMRFDKNGKPLGRFGMISGLAGGFSMPVDIAVDRKNGRVIVVDINRVAVIFFARDGKYLFEFGGVELFNWPRAIATDDYDRVYIADGSHKIRVFQIIEDAPVIDAEPQPQPDLPPATPEPPKDEVAKMVAEEGMLLPVFFAVDSSKLTETDLEILNKNAEWLKKNADVKINVRGYADERGTDEYNIKLSEKRAKAVMDYLIKQGVGANRLKFIGYGKELSTDTSEAGLARSRRVDFLVVK